MKQTSLTLLLLLIMVSSCASSDRAPSGGRAPPGIGVIPEFILSAETVVFLEADTNADRTTSRDEIDVWAAQQWRIISQGMPSISRMDLELWIQSLFGQTDVAAQFGPLSFDRDMNRQVTADEFNTELLRRFALRDTNANASVDRGELFVRLPRPSQRMQRPPGGRPPGGPPGAPPGGGRPPGGM